jgi:AAA15 family ATPase/GTPase
MLKRLVVRGFKSLRDVLIEPPRLAVLFGPNAAGKSNLLDAMQALSRIGTQRTLADAMGERRLRRRR